MTPRQAAEAAAILEAGEAVPIHYDTLHKPPVYAQVERPAETFVAEAAARGVEARIVATGESFELAPVAAAASGGGG
jgi:L-ascorbate metabolism protein UlaG (beta-lactamase superfamily)